MQFPILAMKKLLAALKDPTVLNLLGALDALGEVTTFLRSIYQEFKSSPVVGKSSVDVVTVIESAVYGEENGLKQGSWSFLVPIIIEAIKQIMDRLSK